jgi:flagellar biosynthesis/type III secretory pathway protein FliH
LFRIDRNFVNLAAVRSVQVGGEAIEADAAGAPLEAAASVADITYNVHNNVHNQANEILNDAEARAKARAMQIIEDAREEAAAILLEAREQVEEERENAWQEGYAEGSERGERSYDEKLAEKLRENEDILDAKLREDNESLKNVISELYDERERTYNEIEEELVNLAIEIVKKIINPAEEAAGGIFESLIRNALRQTTLDGKIVIRVGPVEYERFFPTGSAFFELDRGVTVTASVLRDVSLGEGDCVIDTEEATINAGLDSQLRYIKLAFDKAKIES